MTDRRILIVRCWMIAIVGVLLALFVPASRPWILASFAVSPFGLMIPVFPAGCTICETSGRCSSGTSSQQVQVVIAGVANGTCSECTSLNTTWTLDCEPSLCAWSITFSPSICGATAISLDASGFFLAQDFVSFLAGSGVTGFQFRRAHDGNCAWSGTAFAPLAGSNGNCNDDSATCTVTAL